MVSPAADKKIASATDKMDSSASNKSAISKALDIYEVLEHILSYISTRRLFVIQRVDTAWRSLIQDSDNLQKKMFRRPDGEVIQPSPLSRCHTMDRGPVYQQPLRTNMLALLCFRNHVDVCLAPDGTRYRRCTVRCAVRETIAFRGLPRPSESNNYQCAHQASDRPLAHYLYHKSQQSSHKDSEDDQPNYSPTAAKPSWRNMFLTQPPVTAVYHKDINPSISQFNSRDHMAARNDRLCTVYNPAGVTVGDLVDCCAKIRRQVEQKAERHPCYAPFVSLEWVLPSDVPNEKYNPRQNFRGCFVDADMECKCIRRFF